MHEKFQLQLIRTQKPAKGRIAISLYDKWALSVVHTLVDMGYEVVTLPSTQKVLGSSLGLDAFFEFTKALEEKLSEYLPISYIFDMNGNILCTRTKDHQLNILGQKLGLKTICWWLDDPRYGFNLLVTRDIVKRFQSLQLLNSSDIFHAFIDRSMAREFKDYFKYPYVMHLPAAVSENEFFKPSSIEKKHDFIFIGHRYENDIAGILNQPDYQAIYRNIILPIFKMKRSDFRHDFRFYLNQLSSPFVDQFKTIYNHPLNPKNFNHHYFSWLMNTLLWTNIRIETIQITQNRLKNKLLLFGSGWEKSGLSCNSVVNGDQKMASLLNQSHWGINGIHGQEQTGLPVRIWEHAACGLPTITQNSEELPDYFDPDSECIAFSNFDELQALLPKVIHDHALSKKMGEKFFQRFLNAHTLTHRLKQLFIEIENAKF